LMDSEIVCFRCIKVGSRLRIRITSKGYQNEANCQFPRAIRVPGKTYEAPANAVTLAKGPAGKYFYRVKRTSIKVIESDETPILEKVYKEEGDCVVCMDLSPEVAIVPCGHFCLCKTCAQSLQNKKMNCPMCRGDISCVVTEDQIQV